MEPPHDLTRTVNPTVMQHEYLEMVPPIATINRHTDHTRHPDPLPRHGTRHASPTQLCHERELTRAEVPKLEANVEVARTHERPKHVIWQYFTHAHVDHEEIKGPPHLKTTVYDTMSVVCALCGVQIRHEHKLKKGENEPIEEIKLARTVLHDMWDHLATQCTECPENVRHDMESWQPLPKETRAEPLVGSETKGFSAMTTGGKTTSARGLDDERDNERGGYEDENESEYDSPPPQVSGPQPASAP